MSNFGFNVLTVQMAKRVKMKVVISVFRHHLVIVVYCVLIQSGMK